MTCRIKVYVKHCVFTRFCWDLNSRDLFSFIDFLALALQHMSVGARKRQRAQYTDAEEKAPPGVGHTRWLKQQRAEVGSAFTCKPWGQCLSSHRRSPWSWRRASSRWATRVRTALPASLVSGFSKWVGLSPSASPARAGRSWG